MTRRHVVLLTYGEPPRAELLAQLRYSWRILLGLTRSVADIPPMLLPFIALARALIRVRAWCRERFESPLEPVTRSQAEGLETALNVGAPEVTWCVHVAYEFRDPLLVERVATLPDDEPVDVVPMYVADSAFTHQLARDTLASWERRRGPRAAPVRVLPPVPVEVQAELAARHVRSRLRHLPGQGASNAALVLAAHGTLLDPPRPYETGRAATEHLAGKIARRLEAEFRVIALGWLNHSFGGRWTEPPVDQVLRRLADQGFRRVVYFPFGFLADNAESVLEGRLALRAEPRLEPIHLPCLNDAPELMAALANQIAAAAIDGDGSTRPAGSHAAPRRPPNRRCLDQLEPGERSIILRLDGDSSLERRLMELGLVPGTPIEMVRRAPWGDPAQFRIRDVSLSLRRSETRRIHVAAR